MRTILVLIFGGLLLGFGSTAVARSIPVVDAVLEAHQAIEATNKFGSVRVSYVSPTRRRYEWDGHSRVVNLIVRDRPWMGEQGLYDPAGCFVICRTPRLVLGEAVHDFDGYDQVYRFLYQGSGVLDWVYTSDGLVVGFGPSPQRDQINIDVRQITIHGRKPENLRGARDDDIKLLSNP